MMTTFQKLIDRLNHNIKFYAGYPPNTCFDYSELYPLLSYPINNLGDPFKLLNPFSTHEYESEVIKWFLRLYSNSEEGWGYVTSGSTEGILYGMWNGREKLKNPIVYYSDYAHYCVPKLSKLLNMEQKIVQTSQYGEIDYTAFEKSLVSGRDALIVATVGSTMTSSVDNTERLIKILKDKNIDYYIHADAAFDGMILPFINTKVALGFKDGINSISVSGHKVIGSPIPCGVTLTRENYIFGENEISYVKNRDATITSSRNGFAALILWYAIRKNGRKGFADLVEKCIRDANKYQELFLKNGIKAYRFPHSITIVLENTPISITEKWRIPSNAIFTTLTALPKLTESMVGEIISDIKYSIKNHCLPEDSPRISFPEITQDICLPD